MPTLEEINAAQAALAAQQKALDTQKAELAQPIVAGLVAVFASEAVTGLIAQCEEARAGLPDGELKENLGHVGVVISALAGITAREADRIAALLAPPAPPPPPPEE